VSEDSLSIDIRGVTKRYHAGKTIDALSHVDLKIKAGEFVTLLGPSGCGKSTILRMLAQLHRPSEGTITVKSSGKRRAATAMVFQDYAVFPWKTVHDNVRFGLEMARVPMAEADAQTKRWLHKMGLQDFGQAYPHSLSGGMRQRVSIARALAVEPEVLLMDEPFAALDAQHRRIMQEELLQLWQEDRRTVVFVTHSIDEAILLSDRIVLMSARPGRIIREFDVPFPRPRAPEIRLEPAFSSMEQEIWNILRDEVERAYGRETSK
jgi:NitT/TauT family transport system ATP-binding protein